VQRHIDTNEIASVGSFVEIGSDTIQLIKSQKGGDSTKVINLIKSIEKTAEENSEDPFLIALAERAKTVQESWEDLATWTIPATRTKNGTPHLVPLSRPASKILQVLRSDGPVDVQGAHQRAKLALVFPGAHGTAL
jgi:hypothetical protein